MTDANNKVKLSGFVENERSWIVAWATQCPNTYAGMAIIDGFDVFETFIEAQAFYQKMLIQDDLYSASMCAVIESTDYAPHQAFR